MVYFVRIVKIIVSILLLTALPISAEILRCKGTYSGFTDNTPSKILGRILNVHIEIVLPNENDDYAHLVLMHEDGKVKSRLAEAKKGAIEVGESLGEGKTKATEKYKRNDLIITRMPRVKGGYSLNGFFIPDTSHVWVIRVDVWKEGNEFYLWRTDFNEIATGKCE